MRYQSQDKSLFSPLVALLLAKPQELLACEISPYFKTNIPITDFSKQYLTKESEYLRNSASSFVLHCLVTNPDKNEGKSSGV